MKAKQSPPRQHGAIVFALLAFSLFGIVAYLSVAAARGATAAQRSEVHLQHTLAQAREALIARAAGDDNRPGSLPCPDLLTDTASLANHPGDGKADMLTRNQCPTPIGWLPWVTLGIPKPLDDSHGTLWYILAPGLYDDDSAMPINSDKPTGLAVDGRGEIAALLIAARTPLSHQQRPSTNPNDYIEGLLQSTTGLDYRHNANTGNDRILSIGRNELMAMVEQRVIHSVRHCLSSHARQTGRHPWPAPLAASGKQGSGGTLFGRLPLTQPNDGIDRELEKASADLVTQHGALAEAPNAAAQLAALDTLAEFSLRAKNLFDSLKLVGNELKTHGNQSTTTLHKLQANIASAAENDRISRSEGSTIQSQQANAMATVNTLIDALFRYGLDAMLWQARQNGETAGGQSDETGLARSALLDATALQQLAAQQFAQLDGADPRPLQQALVAPAIELARRAGETAALSTLVSQHAEAVANQANSNITLADQTYLAITGKSRAKDAVSAWQAKPTASNRSKMDNALAELSLAVSGLQHGLETQRSISNGGMAAAWPMIWASGHCSFLKTGPGWWNDNAWSELVFYQIAASGGIAQGDLQVAGRRDLPLVIVAAGAQRAGQQRPSNRIEDYLEGRNADPSRNGEARTPTTHFELTDNNTAINDRIAY